MLIKSTPILAFLNDEETILFYTEKLGFTFNSNWDGYLIFSKDDIQLHLWLCDDEDIPKNTGCYIEVTDIEALYKAYQKEDIIHPNGKLEIKPWQMKQFSVLDNNGNIIHFGESVA